MKINNDKPKCFCGVFGIYGTPEAAIHTYYGLHALQHRGQEASGIVTQNMNEKNHSVSKNKAPNGLIAGHVVSHKTRQRKTDAHPVVYASYKTVDQNF